MAFSNGFDNFQFIINNSFETLICIKHTTRETVLNYDVDDEEGYPQVGRF